MVKLCCIFSRYEQVKKNEYNIHSQFGSKSMALERFRLNCSDFIYKEVACLSTHSSGYTVHTIIYCISEIKRSLNTAGHSSVLIKKLTGVV